MTKGVTVTLDNNDQYHAKYGIVTFSLGVLQSDIVQFVPELPYWKQDALLRYSFTDYIAIYIKWPHRFWNESNITQSLIYSNENRYGFFTWIYNLDHPTLLNGSLIWRFDIVTDLADIVSYENINDTIKQIIELKLSHYFNNIPEPENIFVGNWKTNKYVQGSYASWPVGFDYNNKKAMQWPLKKRLFFAEKLWHLIMVMYIRHI